MKKNLFQTADGKNLFTTFLLVCSLFMLWGFCNGLIDILNKHFQNVFHINKGTSGLVQFANYIAYFLMAMPAGVIALRFGYKRGILIGLGLIAAGAFWFVGATHIGTYWAFLVGLFILAGGMTCLETIANPYTTVLGPAESGATRINMAQICNGVGWMMGPYIGKVIFKDDASGQSAVQQGTGNLYIPYLGIGIVVVVLFVVFLFAKVPDIHAEESIKKEAEGVGKRPLFQRPHFNLGIVAQFLYVAAQCGIFGFFINYVMANDKSVTETGASTMLTTAFGVFLLGRLCGSTVINFIPPNKVLALYAGINVVLTVMVMQGGQMGYYALYGTFFFMSIMFPTIFALAIRGLGEHTKVGSSIIVMSIVGGAVAPPFMGHIADVSSMNVGFVVPLVCFVLIAIYGAIWPRLMGAELKENDGSAPVIAPH